ncbi:MAG: hypothetical protein WBH31_17865 [Promethearchaeia archaeon]
MWQSFKRRCEYCVNCGKSVQEVKSFAGTDSLRETEIKKERRESKYILISFQRKVFLQRILPILLIGSIIWLVSEIFFDFLFKEFEFNFVFFVFYICMIVLEVNIFIIFFCIKSG